MNGVVSSTSIDGGVVVDANGIGIATATPPPPTTIAGIGVDGDGIVSIACIELELSSPLALTNRHPTTNRHCAAVALMETESLPDPVSISEFSTAVAWIAATAGCVDPKAVIAAAEVNVGVG